MRLVFVRKSWLEAISINDCVVQFNLTLSSQSDSSLHNVLLSANCVKEKGKLGANAMKRVAAGALPPAAWIFEPAKRSYDRADYCLDCSFLPQWKHRVLVFTLECSGARPMGEVVRARAKEHSQRTGPPSDADLISLRRGKPNGTSEFRTRDLSIPSFTLW